MLQFSEYFYNPKLVLLSLLNKTCRLWPDRFFLKKKFYLTIGKRLDLSNPKSFNEKLQWLKLNDRKREYVRMVDKCDVKDIVSEKIGIEYIIPTIAVYNKISDIDFDALPNQFVLKCTHDSGGVVVCRDKVALDIAKVKNKLSECLKRNYYWETREMPYKEVRPRIIAENYMEDSSGELRDYKFMCFNGEVKCSFVVSNRFGEGSLCVDFYDKNWTLMPFTRHYPNSKDGVACPKSYNKMIELAEKLAKGITFVRIADQN